MASADGIVSSARRAAATAGAAGQVLLALSPWVPAPRPHRADDVTARWLTGVFAARAPAAVVERVEPLGGTSGTTDRRRLGLVWNAAGERAGLPASVFVKSTPLSAKNRTMVAALWMAVNEVKFYRIARADLGDIAPVAYAAHAGPGARFLLVLEDLETRDGRPLALADDCTLQHAQAMMATLAELHATFWESPRFATDLSWAAPITTRSGMSLLASQFRRVRSTFLKSGRYDLPAGVRRTAALVNENDWALYRMWERPPLTLVHGDSHLGNTYSLSDGRAGLLDWQVVFRCRGIREVSYFMAGGLPIEMRREHERDLVALYVDELAVAASSRRRRSTRRGTRTASSSTTRGTPPRSRCCGRACRSPRTCSGRSSASPPQSRISRSIES